MNGGHEYIQYAAETIVTVRNSERFGCNVWYRPRLVAPRFVLLPLDQGMVVHLVLVRSITGLELAVLQLS